MFQRPEVSGLLDMVLEAHQDFDVHVRVSRPFGLCLTLPALNPSVHGAGCAPGL